MIYIGSDHGGFEFKQQINRLLETHKIAYKDMGPFKYVATDDYPDYAKKVAIKVSANPLKDVGILLCRSGQGVCIVANKFKHVRAALVWNKKQATASRVDDMSNILCLPADYIDKKGLEKIVMTWLQTPYSTESRHVRRIKKISKIESD